MTAGLRRVALEPCSQSIAQAGCRALAEHHIGIGFDCLSVDCSYAFIDTTNPPAGSGLSAPATFNGFA